jgi:hypothetical protein
MKAFREIEDLSGCVVRTNRIHVCGEGKVSGRVAEELPAPGREVLLDDLIGDRSPLHASKSGHQ